MSYRRKHSREEIHKGNRRRDETEQFGVTKDQEKYRHCEKPNVDKDKDVLGKAVPFIALNM